MAFDVFDANHIKIAVESTVNGSGNHVPHHIKEMGSALLFGQGTAGAVAAALGASTAVLSGITITCDSASPETVYVGDATVTDATGYPVRPGESSPKLEINDIANIYVVSTSGTGVYSYIGS